MKMQITFTEVSIREAAFLLEFVQEHLPEIGPEPNDSKPKRKRRTAAKMAQAKHEAEQDVAQEAAATASGDPPPPRRRKKRGGETDPTVADGRRKKTRSTTKSPSDDDITDEDVMKVASEGAQHLTPKWVVDKLAEFGAAMVNDLDQEQRREFVDDVQAALEEEMR